MPAPSAKRLFFRRRSWRHHPACPVRTDVPLASAERAQLKRFGQLCGVKAHAQRRGVRFAAAERPGLDFLAPPYAAHHFQCVSERFEILMKVARAETKLARERIERQPIVLLQKDDA